MFDAMKIREKDGVYSLRTHLKEMLRVKLRKVKIGKPSNWREWFGAVEQRIERGEEIQRINETCRHWSNREN
jgi:hypothetical protein